MRITEIIVEGLFGIFDHTISLNTEDRITIIHGPNGFGKTILLQMLNSLFNGNYAEFRNIPFRRFGVQFEGGSRIWIDKISESNDPQKNSRNRLEYATISFWDGAGQSNPFLLEQINEDEIPSMIEEITGLERIGAKQWLSDHDEILSLDEVIDRFGHLLPLKFKEPDWWIQVKESTKIHLIETQRLLNVSSRRITRNRFVHSRSPKMLWVPTVEEYSNDLAETIQEKLAESAALSQSLDRTFPARLVKQMGHSELTEDQIRDKLDELEKKRSRLEEVGLQDKEQDIAFLPTPQIIENTEEVLSVYVQDAEEKLSVFDEIADKIDLFKQIINERFRYNKMTISKQDGFSFVTINNRMDVRQALLTTARPIGYLRWASQRNNLSLKFEGIVFSRFIDCDALQIDISKLIREVKNKSRRHDLSDNDLQGKINEVIDSKHSSWDICCGHDLVCILSVGLSRILGSNQHGEVEPEVLEKFLRSGYESAYFLSTQLYQSLQEWEASNPPFRIFSTE